MAFWHPTLSPGYTSRKPSMVEMLFYLMRVSQIYASHHKLWFSESVPHRTKIAKAAHRDPFGDLYQPKSEVVDPYSPASYIPPCYDHSHCETGSWHDDIVYPLKSKYRPSLLVGDPELSFLWDIPVVSSPFKIGRGERKQRSQNCCIPEPALTSSRQWKNELY